MGLFSDAAPRIPSPVLTLAAGQCYMPPSGWYWFRGSNNSSIQRYDPVVQLWRSTGHDTNLERMFYFDGITTRIANPTGCAVAASVTTAGSGYTTPPSVTPSAGGSTWQAIVGGAISTLGVIVAGGSGYQYPPMLWIEQPPQTGVQATGTVTIANGTISAISIVDQGAGYIYAPNVALISDPRDTTGYGGNVQVTLTGAGTVTAVVCTNHGNPITSGTVPTLAFGSGSAAATVVMDWTISSVSVTTAGAGYTSAAGNVSATGAGGYVTAAPSYLGNATAVNSMRWWPGTIAVTTSAAGGLGTPTIIDGGRYQGIPTPAIVSAQSPSTVGVLAFSMGGANATVFLVPAQQ